MAKEEMIVGRNSVMEALKSGRSINKLWIAKGDRQGSVREIAALAKKQGIIVQEVDERKVKDLAGDMRHQGVLAFVSPVEYKDWEDVLAGVMARGEVPLFILLDELEDPHNLGAILRTSDAAGAHCVLIPKRRACPLNATVAKTSAGAVEYVPVAQIGNIAQTIRSLKKAGFWVVGADMDGAENFYEANLTGPLLLIVGSEGKGMGRLTKEQCDFLVKIPMHGRINSLNASVACSLLLYEAERQRNAK
ncbi:MAG: 23S rRNA (guanosine(2251)-2'-O)-methyltransferase RlmB [Selenomonadales bacterium]|nr:23S rRNA (guanosine(2251)-2'-O)-methyltransferase RlmB [Selenomonadales bacterium]